MVHYVRGFSAPTSNSNIAELYGEVGVTTNNTEILLSPIGGTVPTFPSDDGEIVSVVSTDVADVGLVGVYGLDKDFKPHYEVLQMNGTTLVNSSKEFTRINSLIWLEKTAFVGELRVTDTSNVNQYRSASSDTQTSRDCFHTMPANTDWFIDNIYSSMARDNNSQSFGTVKLYSRTVGYSFKRYFKFTLANRGSSNSFYPNTLPFIGNTPTDIYLTAETTDGTVDQPAEIVARVVLGSSTK